MFRNVLPDNIDIFATTASDYDESSYACYYDASRTTSSGHWYSVNWMQDSDKEDIEKETLQTQFTITKNLTTTSHVQEYGDLSIGNLVVGQFQGEKEAPPQVASKVPFKRGAPSWEVPLDILYKKLAAATSDQAKKNIRAEIDNLIEKRSHLETIVKKIVTRVSLSREHEERLIANRPQRLTQLECHHKLVKAFSRHCFNFGKNPYAMKHAYILANMCEDGLDADDTIRTMRQVCKSITVTDRIE